MEIIRPEAEGNSVKPKYTPVVLALRVILPCFFAQNLAIGMIMGTFGPLLAATESQFHISRAVASTGIGVNSLSVALFAALVGGVLHKVSLRLAMMAGAGISALGFLGMALLPSFALVLPMYALVGLGACVLALLGPLSLVSHWYAKGRGRWLAVINLPVSTIVAPNIVAALLPSIGRNLVLVGVSVCFLLLIPLLALIVDPPRGARTVGAGHAAPDDAAATADNPIPARQILSNPLFWLVSIGIGLMAGTGSSFFVHVVPFGVSQGMSLQAASALLSTYAAVGTASMMFVGWIADRVGALVTLACAALVLALAWGQLFHFSGESLFFLTALFGICAMPINVLHGLSMTELVSASSASRALGLSYAIKLPLIFGIPPLSSLLYDQHHSYALPFMALSSGLFVACGLFVLTVFLQRGQRRRLRAMSAA